MNQNELYMHRKPARGIVYGILFGVAFWATAGATAWTVSYMLGYPTNPLVSIR